MNEFVFKWCWIFFLFSLACSNVVDLDQDVESLNDDSPLTRFEEWLNSNGVVSLLNIQYESEYFTNAINEIQPNDVVLSLPTKLLLHADSPNSELPSIFAKHSTLIQGRTRLALRLLHEKYVNPSSFWKPYLDLLSPSLDVPMFWGEQDVNYLEGTSCLERITSDLFALIDDYKALFPYLTETYPNVFPSRVFTSDNFVWAWSIIWSRSFQVESTSYLVPLADLLNHQNTAKTTFKLNSKSNTFEMQVADHYAKGAEVFNNYTPRSNCDLLRLYGFVLESNTLPIHIPIEIKLQDVPHSNIKSDILRKYDLEPLPYPYMDQSHYITATEISPKLLQMLVVKYYGLSEEEINEPSLIPAPESMKADKQQIKQELTKIVKSKIKAMPELVQAKTMRNNAALLVRNEEMKALLDFLKLIPKLKL